MSHNWSVAQILSSVLVVYFITNLVSAYGFDSGGGGACETRSSRRARAQLLATIPCDLSMQSYCNLPGTSYPWHAVRRFVHENQGLMKRMYGDIKHISVLKNEFEGNFIDTDDIEIAIDRYSSEKQQRAMKLGDKKNRRSDTIAEPHFRLQSTVSTTTSTVSPSSIKPSQSIRVSNRTRFASITTTDNVAKESETTTTRSNEKLANVKDQYVVESEKKQNEEAIITTSTASSAEESIKFVTLSNEVTTQKSDTSTSFTSVENITTTTPTTTLTTPVLLSQEISQEEAEEQHTNHEAHHNIDLGTDHDTDDEDDLEYSDRSPHPSPQSPTMEGQLFQDTVQKETAPPVNVRGVNACPVKEEVVAPFWANNTRGEVLALLNLYPFEQYIHWEKCTSEHKQMFCRDGCRCEQQFSLHRLLAYDPHNECRGIFSDWFRFPSCCICKCYDIPFDYRVTSRSPRNLVQNELENAQEQVRSAMYEHSSNMLYQKHKGDDVDLFDEGLDLD